LPRRSAVDVILRESGVERDRPREVGGGLRPVHLPQPHLSQPVVRQHETGIDLDGALQIGHGAVEVPVKLAGVAAVDVACRLERRDVDGPIEPADLLFPTGGEATQDAAVVLGLVAFLLLQEVALRRFRLIID
jgi:hypothetical protein